MHLKLFFLFLLLLLLGKLTSAQTDSVIIEACYEYEFGDVVDSSLSIDTFDIATGLLRCEVEGTHMTTYSYNQFNQVDTILYFNPLTDTANRTVHLYTAFQKDSIILQQSYNNSVWTNTDQTLYTYDTLQRILIITTQHWNVNVWVTDYTIYYTYSGANIDNMLTVNSSPDSSLEVYAYDTAGNYSISYYYWSGGQWDTLDSYANYNSQGQILSSHSGDAYFYYEYDSLGRLISMGHESSFQGWAWSNTDFNYSCTGFLLSTEYSYQSDQNSYGTTCNYYYQGLSNFYIAIEPNHTICSGGSVQFNDSVIFGTPPYSYSWSPSTGLSSDTILNPLATPDSSTIYYLTATDNLGNIFSGCVSINVNPTPEILLTALDSTSICFGDSVHLLVSSTISSGNYYKWYRNSINYYSGNDSTSLAIQSGNYHVTVYSAAGCNTASDTISVVVNNSAFTSISINTTNCIGDTATLSANPLYAPFRNYQWYLDSVLLNGATDSVLLTTTPGMYSLFITCDTSACVFTSFEFVHFASQPVPDIIPTADTIVCRSTYVALKTSYDSTYNYGYYANGTYHSWWTWQPDSMMLWVVSPTYVYIQANNQGCIGLSDSVLIDIYPTFAFNILTDPDTPYCAGDSVLLSTSILGTEYNWSTGSQDSIAYATNSGNYFVQMKDTNGCNTYKSILLSFNPTPPVPTISQVGPDIYSTAGPVMQWYLDGIPIPGATDNTYTPLVNGNYTYEITNSFGCSSISAPYFFSTVGVTEKSGDIDEIFVSPTISESDFEVYSRKSLINNSLQFELYTLTGNKIYSCRLVEQLTKVELQGISPGIYFWKVADDRLNKSHSGKIIFMQK